MSTKLLGLDLATGIAQLQTDNGVQPLDINAIGGGVDAFRNIAVNHGISTPEEFDAMTGAQAPTLTLGGAADNPLVATSAGAPAPTGTGISAAGGEPIAATPAPPVAPTAVVPAAPPPGPGEDPGYAADPTGGARAALMGRMGGGGGASFSGPMGNVDAVARRAMAAQGAFEGDSALAAQGLERSRLAEAQSIEGSAKLEGERASKEYEILKERNQILGDYQEQLGLLQSRHQEDLARKQASIDNNVRELGNMAVRPERFYEDRGTAATVGMALAAGLGAFASSINGGPNYALQIIDNAINRDIQAQLANIDNKRAEIGMQDNALGRAMTMYRSQEEAVAALRAGAYEAAKNQLEMLTSKMAPEEAAMRKKGLLAALDQKYFASKQQLAESSAKQASQTNQILLSAAQTRMQEAWHSNEMVAELLKQNHDVRIPEVVYKVDGRKAPLPNPEQHGELLKEYGNIRGMMDTFDKLEQVMTLMDQSGDLGTLDRLYAKMFQDAGYSSAESYATSLLTQLKDVHHFGALDAGVEKIGKALFGDVTSVRSDFMSKLRAARDSEVTIFNGHLARHDAKTTMMAKQPVQFFDSGVSAQ